MQKFHYPPPTGGMEVRCKSSTALCPQAVWRCIAGILLPAARRRCGGQWQEVAYLEPTGSVTVYCTSSTAHGP